ncbi:helix-turn-helix transcriptional regulator [uncultured Aeromicrobium sp.]|uniref:helix-turn-helix transcriptional regulator n=1 Tax=uncultured Aeromicrobium sp. TaxID=337820 RepID=UPI003441B0CA
MSRLGTSRIALERRARWRELNQSQLAETIGVARNTIARVEQGATTPRRPVLIAWALACGVSLHWIETGEAPPSDDGGASGVRPKGLEPLTSCSGEDQAVTWIDEYRDCRWVSSPVESVPAVARMVG